MLNDESVKRLYENLKTEEGITKFFSMNHEKFSKDIKEVHSKFEKVINDPKMPSGVIKNIIEFVEILATKTLEMIDDESSLLEIAFRHRIEAMNELKELVSILQNKGTAQEEKLLKFENKINNILKHETSLEWIDQY